MADIVLPYSPADGAVLSPDDFNRDFYETPNNLGVGEYALYETANGRIEFANLHPGFRVRSHMVRPWQVGHAHSAGLTKPVDFFEDAWQKDKVFYGIAGANITFHQRYDCTLALFFASVFASVWRQRGVAGEQSWAAAPEIQMQMFVDGVAVAHTLRDLPETIYYDTAQTYGGYDYHFGREERLTRFWNLHHTKFSGGVSGNQTTQLLAGWHTLGLHIYVAQNKGSELLDLDGVAAGHFFPKMECENTHRVRVFVRHADAIRLL